MRSDGTLRVTELGSAKIQVTHLAIQRLPNVGEQDRCAIIAQTRLRSHLYYAKDSALLHLTNTVSPMLERWFATLAERLVGSTAGSASLRPAGNDPDGMPVAVRNAARLLWETARREAEEVQRDELESVRSELQAREDALAEAQRP